MKIDFKKQVLPHIIAIFVFLLLSIAFYYPVFLDNQTLYQHDILQFHGSAKEIIDYREITGDEPLWTNSMFSGMPAYLISAEYSGDLFRHVKRFHSLFLAHPADLTFTCMICFYICLLIFGVRPYLALAGGIAFGLSSFNIISIEAGHNMKVWAIAYMPLVIAGIHLAFSGRRWWGIILTAFALALHLRTNHLQITYYLIFLVLLYGIVSLSFTIKDKKLKVFLKTSVALIFAAFLAFGAVFGKMWNVYEYGEFSTRSGSELKEGTDLQAGAEDGLDREYVFAWSSGKLESMTLLIPNFKGGGSREDIGMNSSMAEVLKRNQVPQGQIREIVNNAPTYWGDQPITSGPIYVGAIVVFLFVLGLFVVEKPIKYWLLIATILSIILSWGKNFESFNFFMYEYFPLYNKFRSVSMAITIATVTMPLLGFIALEKLFQKGWVREIQKPLLISTAIVGGISIILAIFAGMFRFEGAVDAMLAQSGYPDWLINALRDDRQRMLQTDAFRSFFFVVATGALIFYYLRQKGNHLVTIVLLCGLVFLDMWLVARRYLDSTNFSRDPKREFFAENEADRYIKQDKGVFRVYNLQNPFNEARTSYHHHSIGGYHGAKMRRYQDLIEYAITPETNRAITNLRQGNRDMSEFGILNMLNSKYIMAGATRDAVIENESAFGNAWFVSNIHTVNSPDQEINALEEVDLQLTAVVDNTKFPVSSTHFNSDGEVELLDYRPNYLRYRTSNEGAGFIVFSEIFYPLGWNAYIDGAPADYTRANYVLRAMAVPAGEHIIEFRFEPQSFVIGNTVMMICSIIILIGFVGMVVVDLRGKKKD
jgi:hypothetical protein